MPLPAKEGAVIQQMDVQQPSGANRWAATICNVLGLHECQTEKETSLAPTVG